MSFPDSECAALPLAHDSEFEVWTLAPGSEFAALALAHDLEFAAWAMAQDSEFAALARAQNSEFVAWAQRQDAECAWFRFITCILYMRPTSCAGLSLMGPPTNFKTSQWSISLWPFVNMIGEIVMRYC